MISGPEGVDLEGELARAGVRVVHAPGEDAPAGLIAEVLPEDQRQVRAVVVADPPAQGEEHAGMGAWHVNAVHEVHFVRSGRGLLQFSTPAGVISVEMLAGDVMVVLGAEHRYLPIEPQEWVMRHAGSADAGLEPRETGRAADPWPARS